MSRLCEWGMLIEDVALTATREPLSFIWLHRRHVVYRIDNHWEVDQWAEGIVREYFFVITTSDLALDLFRNCLTDTWFIQRLYD
ncbi:MAG: hypothetical protein K8J31_12410 [Anaerolineae bacterium]|nr:hypothetical protein [Anaerolineae bacterium]